MNLSKLLHSIIWVCLFCPITFACYAFSLPPVGSSEQSRTPSERISTPPGIDDNLFSLWVNLLSDDGSSWSRFLLSGGICKKGCRDFQITCSRPVQISRSDELNGINEKKIFGMTYIYYDGREYGDARSVALFIKRNGVWGLDYNENGFVDVIKCSW